MSKKMSTEQAVSQQVRERRDGEHLSDNVTALEVDQDGGAIVSSHDRSAQFKYHGGVRTSQPATYGRRRVRVISRITRSQTGSVFVKRKSAGGGSSGLGTVHTGETPNAGAGGLQAFSATVFTAEKPSGAPKF
ncbi:hypothetical protein MRX96_028612 [Rhipicephalus microplus]